MWFAPITILFALPSLQDAQPASPEAAAPAKPDGKSQEQAVRVKNVGQEYAYLRERGWTLRTQSLVVDGKRAFDVFNVSDATGAEFKVWFDISRFYDGGIGF